MLQSLLLTFFFLCSLAIQIEILRRYDFDGSFLKKGMDVSIWSGTAIAVLCGAISVGVVSLYLKAGSVDKSLYLYTFIFISGIFLTLFTTLKWKNIFQRFLFSIGAAALLVSLLLFSRSLPLKNVVSVASLLWVSPLVFKYFKVRSMPIVIFLVLFMLFDIWNVYFSGPSVFFSTTYYNYFFLDGFIEFGRSALGMGDFFIGFIALGLLYRDKGAAQAYILATVSAICLFIVDILPLTHDTAFSIFIVIPALLIYFFPRRVLK